MINLKSCANDPFILQTSIIVLFLLFFSRNNINNENITTIILVLFALLWYIDFNSSKTKINKNNSLSCDSKCSVNKNVIEHATFDTAVSDTNIFALEEEEEEEEEEYKKPKPKPKPTPKPESKPSDGKPSDYETFIEYLKKQLTLPTFTKIVETPPNGHNKNFYKWFMGFKPLQKLSKFNLTQNDIDKAHSAEYKIFVSDKKSKMLYDIMVKFDGDIDAYAKSFTPPKNINDILKDLGMTKEQFMKKAKELLGKEPIVPWKKATKAEEDPTLDGSGFASAPEDVKKDIKYRDEEREVYDDYGEEIYDDSYEDYDEYDEFAGLADRAIERYFDDMDSWGFKSRKAKAQQSMGAWTDGWSYMPPTKWDVPQKRMPVCKSERKCSVCPVTTTGWPVDALTNQKILPNDKFDKIIKKDTKDYYNRIKKRPKSLMNYYY